MTSAADISSQPPGPPQLTTQLINLAFTSPQRGYGLFTRVTGSRCQALSGYTADGGARFSSPSAITSWNCADSPPVTSVTADGAGDAFAYGPDLFIAGDGVRIAGNGVRSWRRSPQPGTVLSVSAVGRSVWLLLAECHGAAVTATGCVLRLVESADGGRSWQLARNQPPGAVTRGGGSAGQDLTGAEAGQTWLLRTGASSGYVLAYPATNNDGQPDSAPLWSTTDDGATWSVRHVPCGFDALSAAAATADGVLAVVCAAGPSAGNQIKTTAVSSDGGLTWVLHVGCLLRPGCQDPQYYGYLGQIAVASGQTIYLVGGRSSLLVSSDDGLHWQPVQPLIGDGSDGTDQVIFFGRSDGVVLGGGGGTDEQLDIFRTYDGGRTWSKVAPRLS
jgi:hypothetical protein